jgi:hypothetical protein
MIAANDRPPSDAHYKLHRRYLVPVTAIRLDEHVLAWTRQCFPHASADPAAPKERESGGVYPVVEREDGLVLVAGFSTFAALREAGASWATVYVLEAADERDLLELAGVLALCGGP